MNEKIAFPFQRKEKERDEATTFLVDPNRLGTRNWTYVQRTRTQQQISAENNYSVQTFS